MYVMFPPPTLWILPSSLIMVEGLDPRENKQVNGLHIYIFSLMIGDFGHLVGRHGEGKGWGNTA